MRRILGDTAQDLRRILKNTAHMHTISQENKTASMLWRG
jgi:hypothetical protein